MFNKLRWWFLAAVTGITGGVLLEAGFFIESLSVLQAAAFMPLLFLLCKQKKIFLAIIAGLFMSFAYAIPQIITLHMPAWMAAALLTEITILLVLLCGLAGWCMKKPTVLSCIAFGSGWMLLDWLNYTAIPIWGMAQSMAGNWTAYPYLIGFISKTGISGIFFFIGTLQALFVLLCCDKQNRIKHLRSLGVFILVILVMDIPPLWEKPVGTLRVAAAGWTPRDVQGGFYGPDDKQEEFNKLFADPAAKAATQGAKIFASGEMAFDIDENYEAKWIARFAEVARKNNLYLIVGYDSAQKGNCIFFMNPQGEVIANYLKTYLSPPEWGDKHGNGDLKVIEVDGVKVGGMICHDDNFSRLTRYYGRVKTPLIFSPCWDWIEVKDAHLAAVRARAIECHYAIARSAHNGIAAIIGPHGEILARRDTSIEGPGFVIADVPLYQDITLFSRLGHAPMICYAVLITVWLILSRRRVRGEVDGFQPKSNRLD